MLIRFSKLTKQKLTHTHRPTAKANIANATRKQKRSKDSNLRPPQPIITVAEIHRSEHEMRNSFIFQNQQRRTTNDQSYESVKLRSFTTVPTSHTSCRRSQVKSRNKGKHTYFSIELSILKHLAVTVVNKKRRKEPNYGQELAFQSKHRTTTKTSWNGRLAKW